MGYCLLEQRRTEELLKGGVVHAQVDSSPQRQHDWVLHGSRKIPIGQAVALMHAANRLCSENLLADEESALMTFLDGCLDMVQGVPITEGSGQQSLRRKVRAVAHSLRLSSPSWQATAALMNSFCRFTGDLGVESGFWLFRQSLKKLFGDRLVSSRGACPRRVRRRRLISPTGCRFRNRVYHPE